AGPAELRGVPAGPARGRGGPPQGVALRARPGLRRGRGPGPRRRPGPRAGQPGLLLPGHRPPARRMAGAPAAGPGGPPKPPPAEGSMRRLTLTILILSWLAPALAPLRAAEPLVLKPARVFDGVADKPQEGWVVLVRGGRIEKVGPASEVPVPAGVPVLELPGMTLLPGLI